MVTNAKITISGIVQGVGYRWFADRLARKYELNGFVENLQVGNVYMEVEGEKSAIELLVSDLRKGPKMSHVEDVKVEWGTPHYLFINFRIKA